MAGFMKMMFKRRATRRLIMLPVVLVAAILSVVAAPIWIIGATIADAVIDWRRHRYLRVGLMMSAYLVNEIFGLTLMAIAWVLSGFGLRIQTPWSQRLHGRIHGRWTKNLYWCTRRLLGADVTITNAEVLEPSPVAILSRHISLLDAVMPSVLVCANRAHTPRHVLMQELLWSPCFDVIGNRTPNFFVDRAAGGETALAGARWIGSTAQPDGSVVIFPEGGFRTPRRFARAIERLQERDPDLAARASVLKHVLPPRPGGSRAMLDGAEGVDVVLIAHTGYEGFGSLKEIIASVPFRHPVELTLRRIPRAEVPTDESEFNDWLLSQYEWIDEWVEQRMIANGVKQPDGALDPVQTSDAGDDSLVLDVSDVDITDGNTDLTEPSSQIGRTA